MRIRIAESRHRAMLREQWLVLAGVATLVFSLGVGCGLVLLGLGFPAILKLFR